MTLETLRYRHDAICQCGRGRHHFRRARRWRRVSPPYRAWRAFPLGTASAKGLAALPDIGAPSPMARRRRRGSPPYLAWRAFPRGTAAAKGLAALPAVARVPTGTLAKHPPSPRLRRTRTLGPPPAWLTFLRARRRRRVSPPYQTLAHLPPWHGGGEGSRRPTRRWRDFLRAPWPSIRSALPHGTTAAKGLAALPAVARVPTGTTATSRRRTFPQARPFPGYFRTRRRWSRILATPMSPVALEATLALSAYQLSGHWLFMSTWSGQSESMSEVSPSPAWSKG